MSQSPPSDKRIDPSGFTIGIVAACYNEDLIESLLDKVTAGICKNGEPAELLVERVPGSHEIPCAVNDEAQGGPLTVRHVPFTA